MKEKKPPEVQRQTWANVPSSLHSGINMDSWGLRACSKAWFLSTRHLDWPASVTHWQDSLFSNTVHKPPALLLFFTEDACSLSTPPCSHLVADQYNHNLLLLTTELHLTFRRPAQGHILRVVQGGKHYYLIYFFHSFSHSVYWPSFIIFLYTNFQH